MSDSATAEDDADLEVMLSAPAHVELLQLSTSALAECLEAGRDTANNDEIVAVLPSQRTLDLGKFIKQSFAALHDDAEAESTPISVFFQFMVVVTSLFDMDKYPGLGDVADILHSNIDLNVDLVEVTIIYVRGLDMSTQRNHTIDALTNISNLFTIIMNYIRYELTLDPAQRLLCTTLAASENLIAFVNETVHLIRVRVNNAITVEMRDSFRARLVQFWIALIDNKVLPQSTIDNVVLSFIRHEDVCMVVGHLLSQVEQDQEPALLLFRSLVTSEFVAFLRKDSWRGLREKFLSLAFVKMQSLIARDVLDGTVKAALDVMNILNEILGDAAFLSLLMSSRVHVDMLMAFFKMLIPRSSTLFAPVSVLDDDEPVTLQTHLQLLNRFAAALHAFYCRLTQSDKDAFVLALLESHDTGTTRAQLLIHLNEFVTLPMFIGRQGLSPSNRRAFSSFVTRLRSLSNKTPPPDHDPNHVKSETEAADPGLKLTRLRSSSQKRKVSDLDHYLMQTSYRLTARNVDQVPEQPQSASVVPTTLLTLTERFLAGIQTVSVSRRGASGPWALFAARSVGSREFLVEYTGHRIGQYDLAASGPETRDRIEAAGPNCVVKLEGDRLLDASRTGSVARCMAHSCDPSAEIQRWIVDGQLRLFVFSTKEMKSGDPITIDFQTAGVINRPFTCRCNSRTCTNSQVDVDDLPWEGKTPSVSAESAEFDNALHALATAAQAEQEPASSLKRKHDAVDEAAGPPPPKRLSSDASGPVYRGSASALVRQAQLAASASRYGPGPTPGFTYAPPRGGRTARSGPDSLLSFNRTRGFASRASSHVAIARGIQMHRKAITMQQTPPPGQRKVLVDVVDGGASSTLQKVTDQWEADQQQQLYQQYAAIQRSTGPGQQTIMQMAPSQHMVPPLYAQAMSKQHQAQQQHIRHVVQMYSRLQQMGTVRPEQQIPTRLQQQPIMQPHRLSPLPMSATTAQQQQVTLQQQQQQVSLQPQQTVRPNTVQTKSNIQPGSGDYTAMGQQPQQQPLGQQPSMVQQQSINQQQGMSAHVGQHHQLMMQHIPAQQHQHISQSTKLSQMRPMPIQQLRPIVTPIQRQVTQQSWPMQSVRPSIYVQTPYTSQHYDDNDIVQVQPDMAMMQRNTLGSGPAQLITHRSLQIQQQQQRPHNLYEYASMIVGNDGRLIYHHHPSIQQSTTQWTSQQHMLRHQQIQWHMYQQMQRQQQQQQQQQIRPPQSNNGDQGPNIDGADPLNQQSVTVPDPSAPVQP